MSTRSLHDVSPAIARFRADVLRGLRRAPKRLPCKYFYDEAGSHLFDLICEPAGVLPDADGTFNPPRACRGDGALPRLELPPD